MITGKDIKKLREEHGLTQAQLARAIFVGESTIANYEAERRSFDFDTLKKMASVFGYNVELKLVKKVDTAKNEKFYKDKSYSEIENMSNEDLTDYIFISQSEDIIARICNIPNIIVSSLELSTLNDLLKTTVMNSRRDVIYFKLNNLHTGLEEDIAILKDEVFKYLELEEEISRDIAEKVCYIDFDIYGDIYRDEILSDCSRLLDNNKNDLEIDHEFIFNSEFNPIIYNAQSMDVISYIRDNPILQIRY